VPVLHLFAGKITDKGAALLADHVELRMLDLRHSAITDAGLAHFSRLTNLIALHLLANPITDAGLVHLSGMNQITSLRLSETRITDAGLAHLHHDETSRAGRGRHRRNGKRLRVIAPRLPVGRAIQILARLRLRPTGCTAAGVFRC
jgi:hypothetical protein